MNEVVFQKIIQMGLSYKADFVEIYLEESRSSSINFRDNKVESATAGNDFGIGIRLVYGNEVLYGYTSSEEEKDLLKLTEALALTRKGKKREAGLIHLGRVNTINRHNISKFPQDVKSQVKVDLLTKVNEVVRSYSPYIKQVSTSLSDSTKKILIVNSEGLYREDSRVRSRFMVGVTAEKNGELYSASEAPGALKGFEFFENLDYKNHAILAADRALLMLDAGYIDGGKMPVIMGNAFGGVIFHEACGHPLETEAIRKKASPFAGKLGEVIGKECLTAIDDGTIANAWGSVNIDDEGMDVCRTPLIENGVLKSYLADRIGAAEVGVPRTGSGRRQNYMFAPVARMRNTYIAPGNDSLEEMISSVEQGLYAKVMGGGSVNPATGEFNFSVQEAYEIKNGKIFRPVRGATLIGKGHEILPEISMVGKDLELAAGMCGASSGSVPVTVGQPSLKVDKILVGGH